MGFLVEEGIKAVCFDIDGTFYPLWKTKLRVALASSRSLFFAIHYNKARQRVRTEDSFLSLPPLSERERAERMCSYMWDRNSDSDISYFLEKEEKVFFSFYARSFAHISPFPGARRTLERLKEEGYPMGVLSDFPVGSKIKAMDFEEFFPIQLSSEAWGRYKPCLTPFQLLSSAMGVEPHAILYVGDSLSKDIRGAGRAGFRTALLDKRKNGSGEADIVFSTWDELYGKLF
ncbi:MAG: HAD family hydrolase [Candidatus Ornithospirochaeta sp.]